MKVNSISAQMDILKKLLTKMTFKDQYCELIRKFLTQEDDCLEIIKNSKIAVFDRLAYILRYWPQRFEECLDHFETYAIEEGAIEAMVIVGGDPKSTKILQSYYDKTLDLQTVGLLGCVMAQLNITQDKNSLQYYEQFYGHYKEWLNRVGEYTHRAFMDQQHFD